MLALPNPFSLENYALNQYVLIIIQHIRHSTAYAHFV